MSKKTRKVSKKKSKNHKNYNPKLIIKQVSCNKTDGSNDIIKINVVRDDLIEAGSKQRALVPYFEKHESTEFVYVCPYTGGAQVSLAYSALLTNKKITLFINRVRPRHPLTRKALSYGTVNLIEINNGSLKRMNKIAKKYIEKQIETFNKKYITLIELGFTNNDYRKILVQQLKKAIPLKLKNTPPKRMWVPTGSTVFVNALYKVFPKTHFLVVQTGKTVWPDQIQQERTTLYKSKEWFYDKAKRQPPYPTTKSYDAKAWTFVEQYGENGDYIWNITSDN